MSRDDPKKDKPNPILDIAEHAILPIDFLSPDGEILTTSVDAARRLGGEPDDFIGQSIYDLVPEMAAEYRKRIERALTPGACFEYEDEIDIDGETRWYLTSYQPVEVQGDTITAIQLVSIDITRRKKMDQALQKREAEFRSVVDATGDGIIATDEKGEIYVFNPAAEVMFGRARDEMIGRPIFDLMAEVQHDRHRAFFEDPQTRNGSHPILGQVVEVEGIKADGTVFPIAITVSVGSLEDQPFIIAVIRDITEEKRAEEEKKRMEARLLQAQKLESLSVMAGGIAHDFNNLLMGIIGNADMAKRRLSDVSPARPLVENIISASQRAAELTRQMLAYSGRGRFVIRTVDLNEIVWEMAHLLETTISKDATLNIQLQNKMPAVEVDVIQIQQIIMNLIINASEAVVEQGGGDITVKTVTMALNADYLMKHCQGDPPPPGDFAVLEVSDTGPGMSEEVASQIFDPFFTTKFTGRGLGLSAVLGIVQGHKGGLIFHSVPGGGTSFKVLLPAQNVAADSLPMETAPSDADDWLASGTILLVDDEEWVRTTVAEMLRQSGFKVRLAINGDEAKALFTEFADEIDCVLLDLTMPKMGGRETFAELSKINENIPIILTSGYDEEEVSGQFSHRKPAGFLQKPYETATLKSTLKKILEPKTS